MISLGIDIGGTGCKCVAFRDDGTQLALSYAEYPVPAGTVNLPPEILTVSVYKVRCNTHSDWKNNNLEVYLKDAERR